MAVGLEARTAAGHQFRGMQHEFDMPPTLSDCQIEEAAHAGEIAPVWTEPMRDGQEAVDKTRPEARVK